MKRFLSVFIILAGLMSVSCKEKYVASVHRKTGLQADAPDSKPSQTTIHDNPHDPSALHELFSKEMREQLGVVFSRMERPLILKLSLDDREISAELEGFISSFAALSDMLKFVVSTGNQEESFAPCVEICKEDGTLTGIAFHGVPGGHEFTSFVLGIYNAAGPGQEIDEDSLQKIHAINKPTDIKILVTLSCTMCPDLVKAAQKIAAVNPNVTAHVYDIHHFEELKNRYNVMSVPCMIIDNEDVYFGKKNIQQILQLLN